MSDPAHASGNAALNNPDTAPSKAAGLPEPAPISDVELVSRSQHGDTQAFEELVSRYRGKVYGLVYGMARNESDAQDLCQETFIRAWQSLARFRGQSSFYTWLYRIATNLTIDLVRRRQRAPFVDVATRLGSDSDEVRRPEAVTTNLPSDDAQRSDIRVAIDHAMEKLTPEHRAVVLLKDFEGLEYKEIAKIVGCSAGTVMSRLFYARRHLQRLLKGLL
ncbi:MAG: sigma-70 family RNA polymerase sigma factor [Verrucomicrobia bacterium]|nr:sigma-70 family RNA polymerase sigma factor [Verrucomicrobiota bacterium]